MNMKSTSKRQALGRKYLLMSVALVVCGILLYAVSASAASSGSCGDGLTWVLDDNGVLTISGNGGMSNYSSSSGGPWEENEVKKVVIKQGVTSIGDYVFSECSSLTEITIPDSVTRIGQYAFKNCSSLTEITIPDSVTRIGQYAFKNCSSLTEIAIPDGVTSIGTTAFYNCSAKRYAQLNSEGAKALSKSGYSFWIPGANYSLKYTFSGQDVTGLQLARVDQDAAAITIPDGVTSIGNSAFYNCSSLTEITIPDGVTSISIHAFYNCSAKRYAQLNSEGAKALSKSGYSFWIPGANYSLKYTFSGQDVTGLQLARVDQDVAAFTIPDGVTSIGNRAFSGCNSLSEITIPDGVTSIASSAFSNCSAKIYAQLNSEGAKALSKAGYTFRIPGASYSLIHTFSGQDVTGLQLVRGDQDATAITIPDGVTSIGYQAFSGCSSLSEITIPDDVTSISSSAFSGCSSLTEITIPDSVTSIGSSAFSGCSSLTEITIPDGVTSIIGSSAFYNCSSLTEITIPDGVTSIGDFAFSGCSSLTEITIPDGMTSIASSAFFNCSAKIYAQLNSEGAKALSKSGYSFWIPGANYSLIHTFSGQDVTGLQLVRGDQDVAAFTIPDGVTSIGNSAFSGCNSLTEITIPDTITSIASNAFSGCSAKRYAQINSEGAKALSKAGYTFRIPGASYSLIHTFSGQDVTGLQLVRGDQDATAITIPDGVTSIGYQAFSGCSSLTEITIPDSVTSIGDSAFFNCSSLTEITIPDSVTSIGSSAFSGCSSLTEITIPDGVTSIGSSAFYNCSSLTEITIPDGVTSIGDFAFSGCSSLTEITIPDGMTSIASSAFFNCSAKIYAQLNSEGAKALSKSGYSFRIPGANYSLMYTFSGQDVTGLQLARVDQDVAAFTIPDGVTSIGNSAFSGCNSLTEITIPEGVTSIASSAFSNCSAKIYAQLNSEGAKALSKAGYSFRISGADYSLKYTFSGQDLTGLQLVRGDQDATAITIPDGVTSIGYNAFSGCSSLMEITIPDSVTSIGTTAFYNCSSLTEITIPDSVTSIGSHAFLNCSAKIYAQLNSEGAKALSKAGYSFWIPGANYSLKYTFSGQDVTGLQLVRGEQDATAITIPDGVTSIGNDAFKSCSSLTEITIPDSVTSIGSHAFSGCSSLTEITIPDGVTSIGSSAFFNCSSLTEITIPDSVTSIGDNAFTGCSSLMEITIPDGVTSIGNSVFYACNRLTNIFVPETLETFGLNCFPNKSSTVISCYKNSAADVWLCANGYTNIRYISYNPLTCKHRKLIIDEGYAPNYARTGLSSGLHCGNCGAVFIAQVTVPKIKTLKDELEDMNILKLPASLVTVEKEAFRGSDVEAVIVPESCRSIGSKAFANCSSLKYVLLRSDTTEIAEDAFDGCGNVAVTSVDLDEDLTPLVFIEKNYPLYNYYWIHELFGKTIRQANLLLEDELIYEDGFYHNDYFGVQVNSQGYINWISIFNGTKYTLFNGFIGSGLLTVPTIRGCDLSNYGWMPYNDEVEAPYLTCDKYPNRIIMLTWENHRVTSITYGEM